MTISQDETFVRHVHRALRHLYEPVELRLSPLAGMLQAGAPAGVPGDTPSALRRVLLDAIHALKPGPKVPADSNAWRVYQVLCYRFEEQFSQEEVAGQMAVSPRHVRRLEYVAIRALADYLAHQYGLAGQDAARIPAGDPNDKAEDSPAPAKLPEEITPSGGTAPDDEFDWLKKSYHWEATDVSKLIESALQTGEAMLKATATRATVEVPPDLPSVVGQMTTLRQALLNILIAGMRVCPQGTLQIRAAQTADQVCLAVQGQAVSGTSGNNVAEFIEMARRLANLSEGRLEILPVSPEEPFAVRLCMPLAEKSVVLFVDDNEDILQLMQRYLVGTQFEYHGVRDPQKLIPLAEEINPNVIVLDIMLPEIDGWELLGRLRAHPWLESVPVIISTILPHEQLAASLGAAGFIRKPVQREALLQVLSQQADLR